MGARGKREVLPLKFFADQYLNEAQDLHKVLALLARVQQSKGKDKPAKRELYNKLSELERNGCLYGERLTALEDNGLAHPKAWLQKNKAEFGKEPPKQRSGG